MKANTNFLLLLAFTFCHWKCQSLQVATTRRDALGRVIIGPFLPVPSWAASTDDDEIFWTTTIRYNAMLGNSGSKRVYQVTGSGEKQLEMTVEKWSDAAFGEISILQKLQSSLEGDDQELFERTEDWWLQTSPLPEFRPGAAVFPEPVERRREPSQFWPGNRYLVSFQPLVRDGINLQSLAFQAPKFFLVGSQGDPTILDHYPLTEGTALHLVADLCRAGMLMHEAGIVHRNIQPDNILLTNGRPVLTGFGLAKLGTGDDTKICITGKKGRANAAYALAEDVTLHQSCQRGDAYAMGKVLFETFFQETTSETSQRQYTEADTTVLNRDFRDDMFDDFETGIYSRFRMSQDVCDHIFYLIRGLSREYKPFTFAKADAYWSNYLANMSRDTAQSINQ